MTALTETQPTRNERTLALAAHALSFVEGGIVAPLSWDEWPKAATAVFQGFRSPAGEQMVLDEEALHRER